MPTPDLVAIYDCGGGREGLVSALRDEGVAGKVVSVCNELTSETKTALMDGTLDLVLDTPTAALSAKLVQFMIAACGESRAIPSQVLLPANIYISETL